MRTTRNILAVVAVMALLVGSAHAASITAVTWGASPSTDGSIDWSAGNAGFSHAISFEKGTPANTTYTSADGYGLTGSTTMTFYGVNKGTFSSLGGSGSINATKDHTGGTQKIGQITQEFVYEGPGSANNASLVLTGLLPNSHYRLDLYQSSNYGGNLQDFSFDNTVPGEATLNGISRGNTKITVDYTTGGNTSVTLHAYRQSSGSMHWYAFSNAILSTPPTVDLAITTNTGTGGASGQVRRGADETHSFGGTQFHVKNSGGGSTTRKGYIRFDTSTLTDPVIGATLDLVVSQEDIGNNSNVQTIHVYGMTDESLDGWLTSSATWAGAPANDTSSAYEADLTEAVLLGTFTYQGSEGVGITKSFTSDLLVDFLNDDTNGEVTFILGRTGSQGGHNLLFAGDSHQTFDPPTLRVTMLAPIPEPMTMLAVGLGISGLGGYIRKRRRA